MFVIAHRSTFTYKGKDVKTEQVSRDLGVRYVLDGSVRKADGRVRITIRLVDAISGYHLWGERYDRELKGIFALQDEIARKIVTSLTVKLKVGEDRAMERSYTGNLEAWGFYVRARELFRQGTHVTCCSKLSNWIPVLPERMPPWPPRIGATNSGCGATTPKRRRRKRFEPHKGRSSWMLSSPTATSNWR